MKGGVPSLRVLRQFLFVPSVLNSSAMTEREKLNRITEAIIGAAIQVHRALGPGLLESATASGGSSMGPSEGVNPALPPLGSETGRTRESGGIPAIGQEIHE